MEKLEQLSRTAAKALSTLREITQMPFSVIIRDSAIQRFEYTFEIVWKLLKEYLKIQEGVICNSPKSCFREAFNTKLLTEEETIKALEMTDDRNLTSHTYHEELADAIYLKIPVYYNLMEKLYNSILK
ncbi:MAG TPA: HI0074 family nucleotidyltransferase substrate-binding subunit [bacterium]